jgi:primosomal protein N' (replication factor Y)
VLVQTTSPDAASIEAAAQHDAAGFLAGELERRRELRYPPFAELIRVVCSADSTQPVRAAAARVAESIAGATGEATEILGPAPLFRLRGRERRQVVVKTTERAGAVRATGEAVEAAARDRALRDVAYSVDVDPQ